MKPYTHVLFNNHAAVLLDADELVRNWLKITNRAYEVIKYLVENAFHRKKILVEDGLSWQLQKK